MASRGAAALATLDRFKNNQTLLVRSDFGGPRRRAGENRRAPLERAHRQGLEAESRLKVEDTGAEC